MNPYLSLIIPAFNEETRLHKSLDKAHNYLSKRDYSWEIVVVDDGSTDRTCQVAENAGEKVKLISLGSNMGKGAAVRKGMLDSSGDIRLFTDADFSTPIYEADKILKSLENGSDICIGSRALDYSYIREHQPFYREFMGKTFNRFVQFMVLKGIKDTQCGFKGFKKNAAQEIFSISKINGFGFDVEILFLAKKAGFTICEVPVEWYNDKRSTVNPITDSIKMLNEIYKIKRIHKHL